MLNNIKINIRNYLDWRKLKNKNRFLKEYEFANGVKTGFTRKAGRCFVGSATRSSDGMKLVCVLLNCGPMFEETVKIIEKCFDTYKMTKLFLVQFNKLQHFVLFYLKITLYSGIIILINFIGG